MSQATSPTLNKLTYSGSARTILLQNSTSAVSKNGVVVNWNVPILWDSEVPNDIMNFNFNQLLQYNQPHKYYITLAAKQINFVKGNAPVNTSNELEVNIHTEYRIGGNTDENPPMDNPYVQRPTNQEIYTYDIVDENAIMNKIPNVMSLTARFLCDPNTTDVCTQSVFNIITWEVQVKFTVTYDCKATSGTISVCTTNEESGKSWMERYWWIILIIVLVVIFLILLLVFFLWKRSRNRKIVTTSTTSNGRSTITQAVK